MPPIVSSMSGVRFSMFWGTKTASNLSLLIFFIVSVFFAPKASFYTEPLAQSTLQSVTVLYTWATISSGIAPSNFGPVCTRTTSLLII